MATYTGTDGNDTYNGTAGADVITGGRGNDTLNGAGGDDLFNYRTRTTVALSDGNDLIDGGAGTDLLRIDGDNIATTYDPITDTTVSRPTFSLTAGAGGAVVFAMDQVTTQGLQVTNARSTVTAQGVETFRYAAWTGVPSPSSRTQVNEDRLTIGDLSGTAMTGLIEFDGQAADDWLDASAAINQINALGGTGNDYLHTGSGNDRLAGGGGDDDLSGGDGDDVFVVTAGGYMTSGDGNDSIDGGSGVDRLQVDAASTGSVWQVGVTDYGPASYSLTAAAGGTARFTQSRTIQNDNGSPYVREDIATTTRVETFRFTGSSTPAADPYSVGGGDTLVRPSGEDRLTVGDLSGTDMTGLIEFDGGADNDWLDALTAINQINAVGGTGADRLWAGRGNDTLSGGDGNDWLIGGAGTNVLNGGAGSDTADYSGATQGVRIDLNDGTVTNNGYGQVDTLIGIENLTGGAFNDVLIGQGADNILIGGEGADYLIGLAGNDTLDGGTGAANSLQGGLGDDLYIVRASGDSLIEFAGEGIDTVQTTLGVFRLGTHFENLTYTGNGAFAGLGNAADNRIIGGGAGSTLLGYEGNDYLSTGSTAPSTLIGGVGDDVYVVYNSGDTLIELAGEGYDRVDAYANVTLRDNFEDLHFLGSAGYVGTGNSQANNIRGSSGGDTLIGMAGDDALEGLAGNDILRGGLGADILHGGGGFDIADYSDALASITVVNGVVSSSDINVTSDTLISIEGFIGTAFNDTLLGGAGGDVLDGGLGSDVLAGYGGNDVLAGGAGAANTLIGGLGDDTYRVSAVGDTIVEYAGEGTDTVETVLGAYALRDHLEILRYTGSATFNGAGNSANNDLYGGAGNDVLAGLAGADRLYGGNGDDLLRGGLGADLLDGGAGVDTADYSEVGVGVTLRVSGQSNDGQGGVDTLVNIENIIGTAFDDLLIGDVGANRLVGGLGADTLTGMGGNDVLEGGRGAANTLIGGSGDDTYIVSVAGDSLVEEAGQGTDIVLTALSAFTLRNNIENLTYTGTGAFTGTGNDLSNRITGGTGADRLSGGIGDDILVGGDGAANELAGGQGDDRYIVTAAGDTVVEGGGQGYDTVETILASFALGANVENLIYTGSGDFTGTGNGLSNVLTGGAGADVFTGGGGDDIVNGGGGTDLFVLSGVQADYTITYSDGAVSVLDNTTGRDGHDTLYGVERIRFSDGSVLELAPSAAPAALQALLADGPGDHKGGYDQTPLVLPGLDHRIDHWGFQ